MDQEPCLGIDDDDEGGEADLNAPPMSAAAYLKQVRAGRAMLPEVVSARPPPSATKTTKKWAAVAEFNLNESQDKSSGGPSTEWQAAKCVEFAENREKMERLKAKKPKLRLDWPKSPEELLWREKMFEECLPGATQFSAMFPNHVGTPPALSVVFSLSPKVASGKVRTKLYSNLIRFSVSMLIPYVAEWAEAEGMTRPLREWLFALLLVVEKPLMPDVIAALRDVVKLARRARSSLAVDRVEESHEFSLFIAVIGLHFGQKDLADF